MLKKIQNTFALTDQGVKDFFRGAGFCALANIMLMLPIVVLYLITQDFVAHLSNTETSLPTMFPYAIGIIVALIVIFVTQMWQYNATYTVVYQESARKRISIAERLRKLPLSFFGNRDLADLTRVIMKDCSDHERLFSHIMPQMFGMGASTIVFAIMMLSYDWRLGVAALWPIPVALIALLMTSRIQKKHTVSKNAASLAINEGIQEFIECHREIRSLNKISAFENNLNNCIEKFEKEKIGAELAAGITVCSAQGFLRLGIASVIVTGTLLLVAGQTDFLTFFVFLLAVTRVYDPINVILQAIVLLIDLTHSLDRMRAIENTPTQKGATEFNPSGHDLVFENVSFSYNDKDRKSVV